ncbi:hypothetical protein N7499_003735 [Penicillium canescens]|uniref:Extracellular membrane protein CFEM domain-containing protein n=1 Tax=Penicillium canescens TaxID=5083 RepID=A0AAD6N558_PENCN|nr:uncharacterized protein N7446_014078 [Penicillium canescens]KAJ6018467.1 hypothetical protein N7522_001931 [Penicillium canescens]KAJ6034105.1 hypothetical protein N7460_009922 [Penicillium canescens]KAJ6039330.1 hypothetical protein N7446_014078 [Penicillium canescens]KAJ6066168.1 hypothetical protein N7444_000297 [Penicillium canescens]KAJ6091021.1 hypothetical protein N7499_003735 [Penicillium canescens]
MVRIISVITSFLALAIATEACAGWYQCKNSDGSHCCVVDSALGPGACPSKCNGGHDCIGQLTGDSRTEYVTVMKQVLEVILTCIVQV